MSIIAALAPAKVNFTLQVLSRRPDGFHEIDSVVALLDFCDLLTFSADSQDDLKLALQGRTEAVPANDGNLVHKAAAVLGNATGKRIGASVRLMKAIPAGAGLGGGSSDAAATMLALNELGCLGLSAEALLELAGRIGSDVAAFLPPPPQARRIKGRGERVQLLQWTPSGLCLLILPSLKVSTASVYAAWDEAKSPNGSTEEFVASVPLDADELPSVCFNDLEPAAMTLYPLLAEIRKVAQEVVGRPVVLTGSGSAMFTTFSSSEHANDAVARLRPALAALDPRIEVLAIPFRTQQRPLSREVEDADH